MKQTLLYALTLSLGVASFSSCEDYLTQKNPNELTTQVYWQNISDADRSLNAVYNAFKDQNIYSFIDENLRSDIAIQGNKNRSNFDNQSYLQNFNDAYAIINNKWAALYKGVFRTNQLIEGLDIVRENISSETQIEQWNQIKAQAHFFRGLFYFYLSNSFNEGSVPLFDYVPKKADEFFQPLSDAEKIKAFYRDDLNMALELGLTEYWELPKDKGRASAASVRAVLGMSYLYDKEYEIAQEYFKTIIEDGHYKLNDDPNHGTVANEFDDESILEVSYTLDNNSELVGESNLFHQMGMAVSKVGGWTSVTPSCWLVEEFENELVDPKDPANWVALETDTIKTISMVVGDTIDYGYDIFYTQLGKRLHSEYTKPSAPGITYHEDYVFRQQENQNKYDSHLFRRTLRVDADGNKVIDKTPNPEYVHAASEAIFPKFVPFTHDGQLYRLRAYSLRASNSLAINGDEELAYYQKPVQTNAMFNSKDVGYFRKYSNWDIWSKETDGLPINASGVNLRLIRLSDIYLMYAECMINGGDGGDVSEAMLYINKVRRRAKTVLIGSENDEKAEFKGVASYQDSDDETMPVISTSEEVMNHLMYVERPLELCLDGFALRVIDMRRWGITEERFKTLAKMAFTNIKTQFMKEVNGKYTVGTNWGKLSRYTEISTTPKIFDYVQASINYNETKAYWPIPSVEKSSNPYIN